jgi:hypothetical protein
MLSAILLIMVFSLISTGLFLLAGTIATKNRWNLMLTLASAMAISWFALILFIGLGFVYALTFGIIAGIGVYNFPAPVLKTLRTQFHKWAHVENEEN